MKLNISKDIQLNSLDLLSNLQNIHVILTNKVSAALHSNQPRKQSRFQSEYLAMDDILIESVKRGRKKLCVLHEDTGR